MEFLWFMLIGLVAGWLAKIVVPGREPGGFLATLAIGVIGSILGGWIWSVAFGANMAGGLLVAFVGSVVLLLIYHAVTGTYRRRV